MEHLYVFFIRSCAAVSPLLLLLLLLIAFSDLDLFSASHYIEALIYTREYGDTHAFCQATYERRQIVHQEVVAWPELLLLDV